MHFFTPLFGLWSVYQKQFVDNVSDKLIFCIILWIECHLKLKLLKISGKIPMFESGKFCLLAEVTNRIPVMGT